VALAYRNLDQLESFSALSGFTDPADLHTVLDPDRVKTYQAPAGAGIQYNYAAKQVDDRRIRILSELAEETQLLEKLRGIINGEIMNTGEGRMVLHHLARGQLGSDVVHLGRNVRSFYEEQRMRVARFAEKVRSGAVTGSTGKPFDTVVQIGIGGSDLGPRALYLALKDSPGTKAERMEAHFISNVDPDDPASVLRTIDFETTLFIIVSKSGTTQETLTNQAFAVRRMEEAGIKGLDPRKHMVAVTSETSPMANSDEYVDSFYIDDFIGGRYSSSSAVGGAVLSLAFGPDVFAEILKGAHDADEQALRSDIRSNAALLDALIGVYERNVLGMPATAILPYSQALHRFPAHLQQLDMESNGKRVNRFGEPVRYATGPIIFGEPGTNGQHSFYQLLHQGTMVVPLQFVGFQRSQMEADLSIDGSTSQGKLNANLAAQVVAFAQGSSHSDPNKEFPGGRPSSLLHAERLTPRTLGALLAHFENKVVFQGLAWNINSFDQEGVQLGKRLTKQVLGDGEIDPVLAAYATLLAAK
jgi:glucose-6-phosphate isomerase